MNSVCLIGRLTRNPETRYLDSGMAVTKMTLAVDRHDKEKSADFIGITCFGKSAEMAERYLEKGRQIAVQGRIQTGSYKNKNGETVYTTDVIADRVTYLGSRSDKGESFSEVSEKIPF
jgi:single-strand DNA-binding protein